jgi:hypothetical protein
MLAATLRVSTISCIFNLLFTYRTVLICAVIFHGPGRASLRVAPCSHPVSSGSRISSLDAAQLVSSQLLVDSSHLLIVVCRGRRSPLPGGADPRGRGQSGRQAPDECHRYVY